MATDSGASGAPLEKLETTTDYSYPHGHLTHLSASQVELLEEFRKLVRDEGLYTPGPPASHEDEVLLYDF